MKRQDKYPDTTTFHYHNANPKNRITGDRVCRAVCTALQQDYNTTLMEMCEVQCKTGYDFTSVEGITAYMKSKGWVKCKQPRKDDNTKYTGSEFCREIARYDCRIGSDFGFDFDITHILVNIGGHHTVVEAFDKMELGKGRGGMNTGDGIQRKYYDMGFDEAKEQYGRKALGAGV